MPAVVEHATFEARLDELRERGKGHTREGDAIAEEAIFHIAPGAIRRPH